MELREGRGVEGEGFVRGGVGGEKGEGCSGRGRETQEWERGFVEGNGKSGRGRGLEVEKV